MDDKPTYNYTIIIPHHNIPMLLERCLCSIPRRDDLQVIVVDDHSDEASLAELKAMEIRHAGVTFVYLPTNGGGGKARNEGLKKAKGRYVLFADADDFFNYCIRQVLDDYKDTSYDAVYFDANSVDTDTYHAACRVRHLNKMIRLSETNRKKALFRLRYVFGEPWCKMVRCDIIERHHISFSETIIHNDTRYSYLVGYYSHDIHIDRRALYCVTDRKGSVSRQQSLERQLVRTRVFAEATHFYYSHGIRLYGLFLFDPLKYFLIRRDWKNCRKCLIIMRSCGLSWREIIIGFASYFIKKLVSLPRKVLLKISRETT